MVQFEKEGLTESFSIKVENSGSAECLETINAMLFFISNCQEDGNDYHRELYYMCKMIRSMLPTEDQIMSLEDAELLKELKHTKK